MSDMKKFERILKGLANRRRLAVLKYLNSTKEANVAQIAKVINLSFNDDSKIFVTSFSVKTAGLSFCGDILEKNTTVCPVKAERSLACK